ncbi:hypothetical protein BBJ28_00014945 [Nothophytophthora sp. Chile5]|nr:hypothetical protein BBJ28_00014945 [Nothophytophthora sp. Chile5]
MGVLGLLPVLKSVVDQVHISKYAGKTVAIDAAGWLYKGAYSCPVDLVMGASTDAYVSLLALVCAIRLLAEEGGDKESRTVFSAASRAVSVSNEMIMKLIGVLRRMNVTFYVAPYEADAQLAFLSRHKLVDVVISEDSDCVPYGCKTMLFKWSGDGWASELKRRSLGANEELSFVLAALQDQKQAALPENFAERYCAAILTFRHHLVFDPRNQKLKMLNPLELSKDILPLVDKELRFLGDMELRQDVVASIASGHIHPITHESYAWKDAAAAAVLMEQQQALPITKPSARSLTSSESSVTLPHHSDTSHKEFEATSSSNEPDSSQDEQGLSRHREHVTAPDHQRLATSSRRHYEKPRPSSSSSWTHLDSVLGSSPHILNFRSPKVSEDFRPIAALHGHQLPSGDSSTAKHELKAFENQAARTHVKRVRNPTHRRRDGKGSGFDGEVLCRVEAASSREPHLNTGLHSALDRLSDVENAPPPPTKRLKLLERSSSPSESVEANRQPPKRPTPFGCGQELSSSSSAVDSSSEWRWRPPTPRPAEQQQPARPSSTSWRATSAEEKWDRILRDEMAGSSDSDGQVDDRKVDGHRVDSSPSSGDAPSSTRSRRPPLAPLNNPVERRRLSES